MHKGMVDEENDMTETLLTLASLTPLLFSPFTNQ